MDLRADGEREHRTELGARDIRSSRPGSRYAGALIGGHGRAVCGTPDEVITSETLTSLYGTPIEVFRMSDGHLVVVGQPEAPHGDVHAHMVR